MNRILSEHPGCKSNWSKFKYEIRWNIHPPAGRGVFRQVGFPLQNNKNRRCPNKWRCDNQHFVCKIRNEILMTFLLWFENFLRKFWSSLPLAVSVMAVKSGSDCIPHSNVKYSKYNTRWGPGERYIEL
jgi:hypothetical protein